MSPHLSQLDIIKSALKVMPEPASIEFERLRDQADGDGERISTHYPVAYKILTGVAKSGNVAVEAYALHVINDLYQDTGLQSLKEAFNALEYAPPAQAKQRTI